MKDRDTGSPTNPAAVTGKSPPIAARVGRRATILAALSVALLLVVYGLAVWTVTGQRFEDAVLGAAERASGTALEVNATRSLERITEVVVGLALVGVLTLGWLRQRPVVGGLAAAIIVASVVTVELARENLVRPILLEHGHRREDQSFPSGHTAIAMSIMCALLIVVPYRFRGVVVVVASLWASGVAAATVAAGWHRPSDTIGADLIVFGYACAAIAILGRLGLARRTSSPAPPGRRRTLITGLLVGGGLIASTAGAVVGGTVLTHLAGLDVDAPRGFTLVAGQAITLAGGVMVTVGLLVVLHRVDIGTPPPGAHRARPGDERPSGGLDHQPPNPPAAIGADPAPDRPGHGPGRRVSGSRRLMAGGGR